MLIVIVEFSVSQSDIKIAASTLNSIAHSAKKIKGNIAFRVCNINASTTGSCLLLEEWENAAAFEGYKASKAFATAGQQLKPLMTAPPKSRAYEVIAL